MSDDTGPDLRQLNDEYLHFAFIKLTPPSPFITQMKFLYLVDCLLLLFIIYVILGFLCAFYSYPLIMGRHDVYNDYSDKKLHQMLVNMTTDDTYCFHCIQYHIGAEELKSFIENKSIHREQNENLKTIRTLLNILFTVTSSLTFIVFGGSKLIFFISFCSSSLIFVSIYVENISHVVIFETSVVLLSLIVLFKLIYVILFAIILKEKKKNR